MGIKKVEGEMLDHENKMMEKFRKERDNKGNITFTMIKPEAVAANNIGGILKMIEDAGFRISAMKKVVLSKERAASFYEVHKERPFYTELVDYMSGGPIIAAILEKNNAVADFRKLIGSTNPAEADWFDIQLASSTDYIQFPADPGNLLGGGTNGDTVTKGYTFQGNFVYLRAKVDRSWIDPTPDLANVGTLNKIQLNI